MFASLKSQPIIRSKQAELDIQDMCGLLRIHWAVGDFKLHSSFYTRIDQAFLVWGAIAVVIFAAAQFFPVNWVHQAYLWTALTLVGTAAMTSLTHFWARVEQFLWVVAIWAALMFAGLTLTDLGIFLGWGVILANLSLLWLGIVALGYLITGVGMRSWTFVGIGSLHLLGIALLPTVMAWQFLFTGLLMGGSLLLLSQLQWDMRPAIQSPVLTETERQFNRQQEYRRQLSS